jgi:hypothetical protein
VSWFIKEPNYQSNMPFAPSVPVQHQGFGTNYRADKENEGKFMRATYTADAPATSTQAMPLRNILIPIVGFGLLVGAGYLGYTVWKSRGGTITATF